MATLNKTIRGPHVVPIKLNATTSDTFVYDPNGAMMLEINNGPTAALTNVTIKGSAPSAAWPVPGLNLTVALNAGYIIPTIPINGSVYVMLDTIAPYLEGSGTVTITNASGASLTLNSN